MRTPTCAGRSVAVAALATFIGFFPACNAKKDADTGSSGPPAAATAAAAAKGKCAPGEFSAQNDTFCLKLPAGWTAKYATSKTGMGTSQTDVTFENPSEHTVYITAYFRDSGASDYEAGPKNVETDVKQAGTAIEAQGNVPKGTGVYRVYTNASKAHRCLAFLLSGKTSVTVDFTAFKPDKIRPELLDACKSAYAP